MIIDAHNHSHYNGVGPEGLIAEMDAFGIAVTWLLTWVHPPAEHIPSSHRAFNPRNVRPDGTHAGVEFTQWGGDGAREPDGDDDGNQ